MIIRNNTGEFLVFPISGSNKRISLKPGDNELPDILLSKLEDIEYFKLKVAQKKILFNKKVAQERVETVEVDVEVDIEVEKPKKSKGAKK